MIAIVASRGRSPVVLPPDFWTFDSSELVDPCSTFDRQ
jgi:hypothetical protein